MNQEDFLRFVSQVATASRLGQEAHYIQHGVTRCLLHSIAVAYYCDCLARGLRPLRFRRRQLLRGALLHDYFLSDWHDPDPTHQMCIRDSDGTVCEYNRIIVKANHGTSLFR